MEFVASRADLVGQAGSLRRVCNPPSGESTSVVGGITWLRLCRYAERVFDLRPAQSAAAIGAASKARQRGRRTASEALKSPRDSVAARWHARHGLVRTLGGRHKPPEFLTVLFPLSSRWEPSQHGPPR